MKHTFCLNLEKMDKILEKKISLNVGGTRFETFASTLERIPNTRLALLASLLEADESYDSEAKEYFFDQNPQAFAPVLHYYRTEELHVDQNLCGNVFRSELEFWGLQVEEIEPCCWTAYSKFADNKETLTAIDSVFATKTDDIAWEEDCSKWEKVRRKMWNVLENPSSSRLAKAYVVTSMMFVCVSIGIFVLETHCWFKVVTFPENTNMTACDFREAKIQEEPGVYETTVVLYMEYMDYACFAYFMLEIGMRLIFTPNMRKFIRDFQNMIDVVCVMPHLISIIVKAVNPSNTHAQLLKAVMLLRVVRLLRIFRLMKHYVAFKILVYTIKVSTKELLLIIVLLFTGVLIFACLIYLVERDNFDNIPVGIWWALVTMTTVGYGDKVPKKEAGFLIGSVCVICGVLTIAFTVPIVVNNFTLYYSHAQSRTKAPIKKRKDIKRRLSCENNCRVLSAKIKPINTDEKLTAKMTAKMNNTNDLSKMNIKMPPKEKNIYCISGAPIKTPSSIRGDTPDTVRIEQIHNTVMSTTSLESETHHRHEEESRQLISSMADADRKRMEERRRQVLLMARKRDQMRKKKESDT